MLTNQQEAHNQVSSVGSPAEGCSGHYVGNADLIALIVPRLASEGTVSVLNLFVFGIVEFRSPIQALPDCRHPRVLHVVNHTRALQLKINFRHFGTTFWRARPKSSRCLGDGACPRRVAREARSVADACL